MAEGVGQRRSKGKENRDYILYAKSKDFMIFGMQPGKKRHSYWQKLFAETFGGVSLVEMIADIVGGIMSAFFAVKYGIAQRSELWELVSLAIGGAVFPSVVLFLIRFLFITPAKMYKELEGEKEKLELQITPAKKPIEIESIPIKEDYYNTRSICEVLLHNPNQPVSGVGLRLMNIDPPLICKTGGIPTNQICLSAIQFSAKDMNGGVLKEGQAARFDIFSVKRGAFDIDLTFIGQLPRDNRWHSWLNDFPSKWWVIQMRLSPGCLIGRQYFKSTS